MNNLDCNQDELKHYGVLGMKWGVRKARKLTTKASAAKSRGDNEAASRYSAKAKKIQQKHTVRSGGKKAYDYSAKESVGKSVGKSLIFGTYGALRYNEARAKGADRGEAAVKGLLYGVANNVSSGILSIAEPRLRGK